MTAQQLGLPTPSVAVEFFVPGTPVAKGSSRIVPLGGKAGGRPIITSTAKGLPRWAKAIREAGQPYAHLFDGPVGVVATFYLQRPKTVKRYLPTVPPDVDKYLRGVLDPLHGLFFKDDSQVTDAVAMKRYADGVQEPGVQLYIYEVAP